MMHAMQHAVLLGPISTAIYGCRSHLGSDCDRRCCSSRCENATTKHSERCCRFLSNPGVGWRALRKAQSGHGLLGMRRCSAAGLALLCHSLHCLISRPHTNFCNRSLWPASSQYRTASGEPPAKGSVQVPPQAKSPPVRWLSSHLIPRIEPVRGALPLL